MIAANAPAADIIPPPAHPWRDRLIRTGARAFRHKAANEAAAFEDAPRFRVTWPRRRPRVHGDQTLRAFIQINILPRPN